jgi:hypothetical protein
MVIVPLSTSGTVTAVGDKIQWSENFHFVKEIFEIFVQGKQKYSHLNRKDWVRSIAAAAIKWKNGRNLSYYGES